jgi:hypothetical protein
MDEQQAADLPLRDMDRPEGEHRQPAVASLSTADLAGTTQSPAQDQANRRAEAEVEDKPAPPVAGAATATPEREQAEGRAEPPTTGAPAATPVPAPAPAGEPGMAPLFSPEQTQGFRTRWQDIQGGFVDEPRRAVEQADGLVAEVMKQLAQGFADERSNLESQWDRGEATETEELRLALRRYRSFFDRLLSV